MIGQGGGEVKGIAVARLDAKEATTNNREF
jgi:hypothetical protein